MQAAGSSSSDATLHQVTCSQNIMEPCGQGFNFMISNRHSTKIIAVVIESQQTNNGYKVGMEASYTFGQSEAHDSSATIRFLFLR